MIKGYLRIGIYLTFLLGLINMTMSVVRYTKLYTDEHFGKTSLVTTRELYQYPPRLPLTNNRQTFGTRWISISALLSRVYPHFGHTSTLLQSLAPSAMSKARQVLAAANTPAHLVPLVLARPMSLGPRQLIGSNLRPHLRL